MPDSSDNVNAGVGAMVPDASTSPVDWSRPIEAVHEDGRVMDVTGVHEWANDQWPHCGVADMEHIFLRDDGRCSRVTWGDMPGWRIRNVQPTTPELDPALWDRMVALVREMASRETTGLGMITFDKAFREARAIVADFPKPVDPDLIEAREMEAKQSEANGFHDYAANIRAGKDDDGAVRCRYEGIKRGRELATPEVSHVG